MAASIRDLSVKLYVNLVGALASGFLLAYIVLWHNSGGENSYYDLSKYVLLAVGSYVAATLISHKVQHGKLLSKIPTWVAIAVLGSMILVGCTLVSYIFFLIRHSDGLKHRADISVLLKMFAEIKDAALFFVMFTTLYSLFTLPIMAIVYYTGYLIKWSKR